MNKMYNKISSRIDNEYYKSAGAHNDVLWLWERNMKVEKENKKLKRLFDRLKNILKATQTQRGSE